MKTVINEKQRGFLFKNGRFIRLLTPGRYYPMFGQHIESFFFGNNPVFSATCALDVLLRDKDIAAQSAVVEVKDEQLALHFVNGQFLSCLTQGKYAFWNIHDRHEFKIIDISSPEAEQDVPRYIFARIPSYLYVKVEVQEYQKARIYYDNKLVRLLDAGVYYFWTGGTAVKVDLVDTRLIRLDITGQEILTLDKVSLRVNFVCSYRVSDYIKILTEIDNYEEHLHVRAQLALREYIGRHGIDDILENKDKISSYVLEKLREGEGELYIEIVDAGVKDIILPGEIREIMNTVLIAEKRAQANVITRREEVASTRSLLNTAKLMDENQTLYKLKELEYLERISERIGNISLNGGGDIISQLMAAVGAGHKRD